MITKQEQHLRNLAARHKYRVIKLNVNVFQLTNEDSLNIGDPGTIEQIEHFIHELYLQTIESRLQNVNAHVIRRGEKFITPNGKEYSAKGIKQWWNKQNPSGLKI
jgi:hypothetical protein